MAIINTPDTSTFDLWRQDTNQLAEQVGDLSLLITPVSTDLVSAINSLQDDSRAMLVRSIAMS